MFFFKVNNENTTVISKMGSQDIIKAKEHAMMLLWCLYCYVLTDFTHCSEVSIVDFEQVNTD